MKDGPDERRRLPIKSDQKRIVVKSIFLVKGCLNLFTIKIVSLANAHFEQKNESLKLGAA